MSLETNLKKSNVRLMRHPETRAMAGMFVSGKVEICDDVPTACTDGWNTYYGTEFCSPLTVPQLTAVVLHENLHKFLKHTIRFKKIIREDAQTANAAMDYAVNAIIHGIKDKTLVQLPDPHLYDAKFTNWTVTEIYNYLKKGQKPDGGNDGQPQPSSDGKSTTIRGKKYSLDTLDEHLQPESGDGAPQDGDSQGQPEDRPGPKGLSKDEADELESKINEAIQQGAIIAGAMGVDLPRALQEVMAPEIDWRRELEDFLTSSVRGADEYTFRKLNRKFLADDYYVPTMHSETMTEIVVAIDTSGSINDKALAEFADHIATLCQSVSPEQVRVLWWDTKVHGQQIFQRGDYENLRTMLKPQGGGGTYVTCVSDYLAQAGLSPECVVVLTDGYVEGEVNWQVSCPTLWLVTENSSFTPPAGRRVAMG